MNKILLLVIIVFSTFDVFAQNQTMEPEVFREFKLSAVPPAVSHSLYNKLSVIDFRKDHLRMGIGQFGMLNKRMTLVLKPDIEVQLENNLKLMTDSTAEKGEMVLCLKKFLFAERSAAFTEEGFCSITAELYRKSDSQYYLLEAIDTVLQVKQFDVTKRMIHNGDSVFQQYISRNLKNAGHPTLPLSYAEVISADSIAKSKLALYTQNTLTNGIYMTYTTFKNQQPDFQCKSVVKKNKLKSAEIALQDGSFAKVDCKQIYAIVADGIPFIATKFGFYRLKKQDNDWYFIGKMHAPTSGGTVMAAWLMIGFAGAIIANETGKSAYFYSSVNYKTGYPIRLKEILFGEDESEESNWYYSE